MASILVAPLLRNGYLLVLSITLILIAGLAAWSNLPRIEDPRITTRNATVITPLPGADAARVEALVTRKLEEALREVAEIKTLESTSRGGVSLIAIELDDRVTAANNARIFSRIRDKLADAERELPPEAGKPDLDDQRGAVAYSLIAAVSWEGVGEPQLTILNRLAEELADRLRYLPGVEQVVRFGAIDEEIRVTVDPDELAALGLTVADLAARLAAADSKQPAGALRTRERQIQLEVAGEFAAAARRRRTLASRRAQRGDPRRHRHGHQNLARPAHRDGLCGRPTGGVDRRADPRGGATG